MIECLLRDADEDFDVHVDVLKKACRGVLRNGGDEGEWFIDADGKHSVYISYEPPGLQISFEEAVDRVLAERVVADIVSNLGAATGSAFHAVWLS